MNEKLNYQDWNFQVLMLVQSLIGAISPNFRMIAISHENDRWVLRFYLKKNIDTDVEEIEDIVCQYTAFQGGTVPCRTEIVVGEQELPKVSPDEGRVVFRMREE